jgi:hypothetical protein
LRATHCLVPLMVNVSARRVAQTAKPPAPPELAALPFPPNDAGLGQALISGPSGRVRRSVIAPLFDIADRDARRKNAASETAKPPALPALSGFHLRPTFHSKEAGRLSRIAPRRARSRPPFSSRKNGNRHSISVGTVADRQIVAVR